MPEPKKILVGARAGFPPRLASSFTRLQVLQRLIVGLAAALIVSQCAAQPLMAQRRIIMGPQGPMVESADADSNGSGSFPAPDRATVQQLARAREAVKQGRSGEALDGLQEILKSNEDFFIQPDKKDKDDKSDKKDKETVYRSLKSEARSLIGQLPKEGLELYELRCGAEARGKLKEAISSGDPSALGDVASQFFNTQAGNEATFLMGMYYFDRNCPRAAMELFHRLQGAADGQARFEPAMGLALAACYQQLGQLDDCRKTLVDLKQSYGQSPLKIGGREVAWFAQDRDAVAWAAKLVGNASPAAAQAPDDWLMPRGDAARNACAKGSAPLMNLLWRVKVDDDDVELQTLKAQQQDYREKGMPVLPCMHPLAVGDVVLMRNIETLLAIDFATGKRIWSIDVADDRDSARQNRQFIGRFRGMQNMPNLLGQRIWDDSIYGTMSSDGRLVFTIEDLGLGVGQQNPGFFVFRPGGRADAGNTGQYNRLSAHELATQGKACWDLGGPGGPGALPQAETFFLGPPLVMHGVLYVEAEYREEIRLLALDAATGRQLWMQHLAMLERNITQDALRRLSGVSPSYADGVLICPTGAGCAVAVDVTTRSLLWGCRYGRMKANNTDMQRQQLIFNMQNGYYGGFGSIPRWTDTAGLIADGKVILTPVETDALYCLNLADGKTQWGPIPRKVESTPQGDERLYVGCVHQGKVIVVGNRQVEAFRLSDGKPAWESGAVKLPDEAFVSGRGYCSRGHYFLPLSSAEVADIDLDAGKIVATAKSQKGSVPGNLICHRGMVLSQGLDGLEKFYQIDAARETVRDGLSARPNDPDCLSLGGELLLNDGKPAEAVAQFRKAYALDASGESHERTRELFRDALLSGLDKDFAGHRGYAAEIESLLDDNSQRSTYLRLMAVGFHKAHDWSAALDAYMKLVDLPAAKTDLEEIDRSHLVRRDRWTQARLVALRNEGGQELAAAIDKTLAERLKTITGLEKSKRLEELRRFVSYFTDQPAAAQARAELAESAAKEGSLLEAELALEASHAGQEPSARAAALADEIEMLAQNGKPNEAAALFAYLERCYGDVPCRNGQRPSEFLAQLPADHPLRKSVQQAPPTWPKGKVEWEGSRGSPTMGRNNRMAIVMQGSSPAFADLGLRFDQQQQSVCGYDGQGKSTWEVHLVEPGRNNNPAMYNQNQTLARSCGHVLLFSTGTKIYGLDPMKMSGRDAPLLWSQDLGDPSADEPGGGFPFAQRGVFVAAGFRVQQQMTRMDPFGPTTSRIVCFQRLRNLVAVDPLTGETLWVRKDLPQNVEIFGDDEYVFVLPRPGNPMGNPYATYSPVSPAAYDPNSPDEKNEALVFRAVDGEFLGKRKIPQNQSYDNPYNYDGLERMVTSRFVAMGSTFIGRNILTLSSSGDDHAVDMHFFDPWQQRDLWSVKGLLSGTKAALVAHDAVGILEPNGNFALYALPDGRKLFDSKLQAEKSLTELVLLRLSDQYIVIAHDGRVRSNRSNVQQPPQALPGMLSHPIRRGRVYALSLQGKPLWPDPVDVENQNLLLSQPGGLPLLTFASFKYDPRQGNQMTTTAKVIDRRSGLIVYPTEAREAPNNGATMEIVGDVEGKKVELCMQNSCITFKFTDNPLDHTRNPKTEAKPEKAKTTDAIFDALRDALLPGTRP